MISRAVRGVWREHRAAVLVTLLVVALLGIGAAVSLANADTGAVVAQSVAAQSDTGTPDQECEDDSECWNPCTMGVNGEYPESVPDHYVPGPCRLDTVLPYGLRFQLVAQPVDGSAVRCAAGMSFMRVWVLVVNPGVSGEVRASERSQGCARPGDPFADFASVLPGMYRDAARRLDG